MWRQIRPVLRPVGITYLCASRHAYLSGKYIVATDLYVMRYHDEIVEFRTLTDTRRPESGTIDGSIRTYLHIILKDNDTGLRNLVVAAISIRGKSKAISSDHHAAVKDAAVAYPATRVNLHTRI